MLPAARLGDMHMCPMVTPGVPPIPHVGGPILMGAPNVLIGMMPAARLGDMCMCVGPPDAIAMGAFTVLTAGKPQARMTDMTMHGGMITIGCPTVLVGMSGAGGGGGGAGGPGGGGGGGGGSTKAATSKSIAKLQTGAGPAAKATGLSGPGGPSGGAGALGGGGLSAAPGGPMFHVINAASETAGMTPADAPHALPPIADLAEAAAADPEAAKALPMLAGAADAVAAQSNDPKALDAAARIRAAAGLPPQTFPAPSPEEVSAAAAPGASAAQKQARAKVARNFLNEGAGMSQAKTEEALTGLDMDQPVEVVEIPPPDTLDQYVRKGNGRMGQWFSPDPEQTGADIGLNDDPNFREKKTFPTPQTKALKSTAAPIEDTWTDPDNPVATPGGGEQLVLPKTVVADMGAS